MKKMRWIALFLVLALALAACAGGGGKDQTEVTETETQVSAETEAQAGDQTDTEAASLQAEEGNYEVRVLKGATGMGLAGMMDDYNDNPDAPFHFEVVSAADEITADLVKGDVQIAALPANVAATLYNKTEGQIQVLAINVMNVLYIAENGESVSDFSDLDGKIVYTTGKGQTPEAVLNHMIEAEGIDVQVEYLSEATEVAAKLAEETGAIAMLPEPFLTAAQAQNPNIHTAIDLSEAWESTEPGLQIVTGVIVARKDFVEAHPDLVDEFLEGDAASVNFVNESPDQAGQVIEKAGIIKAAVAEKAIPKMNISFVEGGDMVPLLKGYYEVLQSQNVKLIGGQMPADDFYYEGQ